MKQINRRKKFINLALLMSFSFLFLLSACCKKTVERNVRIAIQPSAAFVPLYVARYTGAIEKALAPKKVTVIWQDFESGPPMNESLSADLSDIGLIGDVPTVLALAGTTKMKLVGIPARGPDAYAMLSRADDDSFTSIKDVKGKRIATVFGSTGHNFTKKLLEDSGLTFSDIEYSNISAGWTENSLVSGYVDAVVIWEPNVSRLVDKGVAKIVAEGSDTNLRGTNGFVVREEYLATNKDVISIILQEYTKASKNLESLDPEILGRLAEALNVSGEQVLKIVKKYDYSVAIDPKDIAALNDTIKFLLSINNLKSEYPVEKFTDFSCITAEMK